jgi:hypothetical protein
MSVEVEEATTPQELLSIAMTNSRVRIPCETDGQANSLRTRVNRARQREVKRSAQESGMKEEAHPLWSLTVSKDGTDLVIHNSQRQPLTVYVEE